MAIEHLKLQFEDSVLWEKPKKCPKDLPLFRIIKGDAREWAARLSCGQGIAGDGCFSLGMITELPKLLESEGPFAYRRLHWEAGMIGQVSGMIPTVGFVAVAQSLPPTIFMECGCRASVILHDSPKCVFLLS